ncbi:hypothetical protein D9C73_019408 [Collichthys lucidus]|uniref:Uncharacterized protein n=1 Tax=Collichthys lucidus TaxID=240159 RepID=A0A4U5VCX1_COLLU|nr:hypothetical protein D9C73_019408 [Collichthys lucidus]
MSENLRYVAFSLFLKYIYSSPPKSFEEKMERESSSYTGTAGRNTEPASPVRKNINEDNTCVDNSHSSSRDGTCGTTDVARARWTLLRQVLLSLK